MVIQMRKANNQKGYQISTPTEFDFNLNFIYVHQGIPCFFRSEGNKAYPLKVGSVEIPIYCHMTDDLGACGGGGWTLVMKIDGNKVYQAENT